MKKIKSHLIKIIITLLISGTVLIPLILPTSFVSFDSKQRFYSILGYVILAIAALLIVLSILRVINHHKKAQQELTVIYNFLHNDCDPERYFEEVENYLCCSDNCDNPSYNRKQFLSHGYSCNGDFTRAIELLNDIIANETTAQSIDANASLQHNLCLCYLLEKDVENALPHYVAVQSYLHKAKSLPGKKWRLPVANNYIRALDALLKVAQGNGHEVLCYYQDSFIAAENAYGRVCSKFILAEIYEGLGEDKKQRECLEYVVANGNKLYFVQLAKAKLGIS